MVLAFDHPYHARFEVIGGKMCVVIPFINHHEAHRASRELKMSVRPANDGHKVIQGEAEHVS